MSMTKRIYIAGPMTGLPNFNYGVFNAAAAMLRAAGHLVENPAENAAPHCGTWLGWMRLGVAQLVQCDAVYMLEGWECSRGARLEHQLAVGLGLQVLHAGAVAGDAQGDRR